jgi:cysteine desulfurase / selenocysteine lyase
MPPDLKLGHPADFPVSGHLIYLNHAGVAPLCRPAALAMQELAQDALDSGALHYDRWLATYQGLRNSAAKLIGAEPGEIAIVKNTSEGIATVAQGISWKAGDKIVAFREEFPANYLPWKKLEETGAVVEWLSIYDSLDVIDRAATGARLLTISFVQYLGGHRANLEAIGEICQRRGCLFLVDAIQGLGAFPLDVRRAKIHALAADGHKWLLGPEGCGILYVAKEVQDRIEPVEFGWTNVASYHDYASRDLTLRPDAGRYECGTLNTIGCYGLRAALEFILEIGVDRISPALLALSDQLALGASALGYEVLGPRTPETSSGIISIRKAGRDSVELVKKLRSAGMVAAPRQGWVRLSPHFYVTREQIERVLEELK